MGAGKRIGIVLLVLLLATGGYWAYINYYVSDQSGIQATGTIEATSVELNAKAAGTISEITADVGDNINAGQLLAEISRNDLIAQKESAALAVVKAEAQLDDLIAGARDQEKNQAAASVSIARTNYNKAKTDRERKQELLEQGMISQDDFERYKVAEDLALNQLQSAEASRSLVKLGSRPNTIAAARVEVERSRAVLKASEALLNDLKVKSPITGKLISRNYEPGEFVQAGSSIATVADLDDLWIKVYIPTDDLPLVKMGQKVHFTVSGDAQSFAGEVIEIASKGEFTPKTIQTKKERANVVFAVKIKTNSYQGVLKPGMPADVVFDTK